MLALLALGALDKTKAFPHNDVSEEMLLRLKIKRPIIKDSYSVEDNYLELIPPLRKRGRHDLVRAIEQLLERYRAPKGGRKVRIKRFLRKHLNGNGIRIKKLLLS